MDQEINSQLAGSIYGNFGKLTQSALEKFQIKYGIVKAGTPGYGTFGPKTQSKMSDIFNQ